LSVVERQLALLIEGRRAERIIKLWWLAQRHKQVCRFLRELTVELRALRRELEVVKQERDFLKKAAAYFAKGSR